jgi:hypothetical protein
MSGLKPVAQAVVSLAAGTLFGVGLTVADMTDPRKVLAFLDIFGAWDASLLFVLGAAVVLSTVLFRWVQTRRAPVLDERFHLPRATQIDYRLISGAVIFGVGWGLAGYCPGPAIASIGFGNHEALWIVPAMAAGAALEKWWAGVKSLKTTEASLIQSREQVR